MSPNTSLTVFTATNSTTNSTFSDFLNCTCFCDILGSPTSRDHPQLLCSLLSLVLLIVFLLAYYNLILLPSRLANLRRQLDGGHRGRRRPHRHVRFTPPFTTRTTVRFLLVLALTAFLIELLSVLLIVGWKLYRLSQGEKVFN